MNGVGTTKDRKASVNRNTGGLKLYSKASTKPRLLRNEQ